jgi:hypothetical protein
MSALHSSFHSLLLAVLMKHVVCEPINWIGLPRGRQAAHPERPVLKKPSAGTKSQELEDS